ncbi:hypothetical protein [Kordiimonas pumila]|uniref:Uncharacterized protein n=1 Tax=Kordiimonas pumila TaxID=2161677 RepID=A0ABV7D280_9PROT|nr:hypothetical protein [Kordiimonas pumila]
MNEQVKESKTANTKTVLPTSAQIRYLMCGKDQPGGKLPLFDKDGQRINPKTIRACLKNGWCEAWYRNPIKPDWLVCKLTQQGVRLLNKRK